MKACNWSRDVSRARQFDACLLRCRRHTDLTPDGSSPDASRWDYYREHPSGIPNGVQLRLVMNLEEAKNLLDRLAKELGVTLAGTKVRPTDASGRPR